MSTDEETPFTTTSRPEANGPEVLKHKAERKGRCGVCGENEKTQRTFYKVVTPFAMHRNTAADKTTGRPELGSEVSAWVNRPPYHEECMYDFMDELADSGLLAEILPRLQEWLAQRKADSDQVTRLSVVGNGA